MGIVINRFFLASTIFEVKEVKIIKNRRGREERWGRGRERKRKFD